MTRRARLAALLSCVILASGCANLPEESQPKAVTQDELGQNTDPDVQQPANNLDALSVVRDFVHASAQPSQDNARVYLDEAARNTWRPARGLTVIEDIFGTVYATGSEQSADPNEQVVTLRGFTVGTLGLDSAFNSIKGSYEQSVLVRRQPDGQWRMVNPPENIAITYSDFTANYFRVPVYFFSPDSNTIVPDLRYVAGRPQSGLAGRVVNLLLNGPSDVLVGAVSSALPDTAGVEANVANEPDGALVVPLSGVGELSPEVKRRIAAQIVLSLQSVTTSRLRLLSDGSPLVQGQEYWLPSDVPSYTAQASPSPGQLGMMTVGGRVRSLADGGPIAGPAGHGAYLVTTAAQSIDGRLLAVVETADGRQRLRIGDVGRDAQIVNNVAGSTLTRPTWRPTPSAAELWTVIDGTNVARVLRTPQGVWTPTAVNADEVVAVGQITALRLSRDGARAAVIAGGQLLVASVVRTQDAVALRSPRILQGGTLGGVVDLDWASQDTIVAVTSLPSLPVVKVPIDGLRMDAFNSSNLTPPMHAITAAPSRPIIVADAGGLWTASEIGEVWRPHEHNVSGTAYPFYPG